LKIATRLLIAILAVAPAFAEVIISTSPNQTLGRDDTLLLGVSFTLSDTFDNVVIQAAIESSSPLAENGPVYLTNKIGPGATAANIVAENTSFSTDNNTPTALITVLSGLTLGPGTYYLLLDQGTTGIGWVEDTSPAVTLASGVTRGPDYINNGTLAATPFASNIIVDTRGGELYTVTGDLEAKGVGTPEPSSLAFAALAFGLIALTTRKRRAAAASGTRPE